MFARGYKGGPECFGQVQCAPTSVRSRLREPSGAFSARRTLPELHHIGFVVDSIEILTPGWDGKSLTTVSRGLR